MSMPVEKAKRILEAYKENNYIASKALPPLGYASNSVRTRGGEIIDTATKRLIKSGDHDSIHEFLGMTSKDISREYKKVIEQDKNFPAKLRALEPLLKREGITWEDQKQTTTVPILNLTVKSNKDIQQGDSVNDVAQHVLCDTNNMAITHDNTEKIEKNEDVPLVGFEKEKS